MNRNRYAAPQVLPDPQDVVETSVGGVTVRALVMCLVNGDQMDVVHLGDVPGGHRQATVNRMDWAVAPPLSEHDRDQITSEHLGFLYNTYRAKADSRVAEAFWDTYESASASLVVTYEVPAEMSDYRRRTAPGNQPRPARRRLRTSPWLLCTAIAATLITAGCQDTPTSPGMVDFTASCDQNHHAYDVHPSTIDARIGADKFCRDHPSLGTAQNHFGLMPSVDPS